MTDMKEIIRKRATDDFLRYGFKSFTMSDLAQRLGMSKKTLYEYYTSKNALVEDCLNHLLIEIEEIDFIRGEGNVIENSFDNLETFITSYKITSSRPIWELQKYFPKLHDTLEERLKEVDEKHTIDLLNKGISEGIFRTDVDLKFFKTFFSAIARITKYPDFFPESQFPFVVVQQKKMEYIFRILVNEKGLKLLEEKLKKIQSK